MITITSARSLFFVASSLAIGLAVAKPAEAQGDDGAVAQAIVRELEQDGAHRLVTAESVARAKGALERATRMRKTADEVHARAADGLAREYAETGRDLVRAADTEAKAAELRRQATEHQAQVERTRALVEAGLARVGRLRAQLADAERPSAEARTAVETHEGEPPKAPKKGPAKKPAESPKPDAVTP